MKKEQLKNILTKKLSNKSLGEEKNAVKDYDNRSNMNVTGRFKNLLKEVGDEEKHHASEFQGIINNMKK